MTLPLTRKMLISLLANLSVTFDSIYQQWLKYKYFNRFDRNSFKNVVLTYEDNILFCSFTVVIIVHWFVNRLILL